MKIWKVEIWLQLKKDMIWEHWQTEHLVDENIEGAIKRAIAKQIKEFGPYALEVRKAELELQTTIE